MCKCRENGNCMDPWNCHKYITCSNGYHYLFNCSRPALVYDPSVDRCVQPGKRECKQVRMKDPCSKKADGIYTTRDAFQYMVCKDKHASYISCGDNLFDPCTKKCVVPSKVSIDNMCKCRGNGNYMDPGNCHKYVTCSNGYHYLFNCSRSGLVYDPLVDRCVQPGERQCKEVTAVKEVASSKAVIKKPNVEDPCAKKEDGIHETKDVFQYMVCKNKHASYVSCGDNLFDPCTRKCVTPSAVSRDNMCKCRENGNCMDPWNCHKYITCSNGYHYLFNCSRPALVYDPSVDRCVQPGKRECKQVHMKDPCSKKADGIYTTRDAFQYMVCKDKHASYVSCGDNLFDPCTKKCVVP